MFICVLIWSYLFKQFITYDCGLCLKKRKHSSRHSDEEDRKRRKERRSNDHRRSHREGRDSNGRRSSRNREDGSRDKETAEPKHIDNIVNKDPN